MISKVREVSYFCNKNQHGVPILNMAHNTKLTISLIQTDTCTEEYKIDALKWLKRDIGEYLHYIETGELPQL